ncbi:hypothetical protein SLS62_007157 [Diatrype stigma]|uniref:Transcriptional coactivator p15 (PC4) C-terminal domain-containing protein n=1 Tax=Diatrype stigma TaxID=117547 RepID=A0AAN9ULM8_9PEZI
MVRTKFSKRLRDEEEDVASEEDTKPTKKTTKKTKTAAAPAPVGNGKSAKDADGNEYWALSNTRRVNISEFKGKVLVNIREYYTDAAGDLKPGKKGISLPLEQYNALLKSIPSINAQLNEHGHETAEIPSSAESPTAGRPSSSSSDKDGKKDGKKQKAKPKSKKSNIEATSDEDEQASSEDSEEE